MRASQLLLILTFASVYSVAQEYSTENLLQDFLHNKLDTTKTLRDVPKSFFKYINRNGWGIRMTDKAEAYNSTDIDNGRSPNSILVQLGVSEDGLYVMIYDKGGYGISRHAFLFKKRKSGKGYSVKDYDIDKSIRTVSELRNVIAAGSSNK